MVRLGIVLQLTLQKVLIVMLVALLFADMQIHKMLIGLGTLLAALHLSGISAC